MTNEEMARRIQAGERGLLPNPWEAVRKLIYANMHKLSRAYADRMAAAGVTMEDLIQEGYFCVLDALQAYDSGAGYKFTTYLKYPCTNRFKAAVGLSTAQRRNDPINCADSLNEPVSGDVEGTELLELIADPESLKPFEDVEAQIYYKQLRVALEKYLGCLSEQQAGVLRARYYGQRTLKEIAGLYGRSVEWGRRTEATALRMMRQGGAPVGLQAFMSADISTKK